MPSRPTASSIPIPATSRALDGLGFGSRPARSSACSDRTAPGSRRGEDLVTLSRPDAGTARVAGPTRSRSPCESATDRVRRAEARVDGDGPASRISRSRPTSTASPAPAAAPGRGAAGALRPRRPADRRVKTYSGGMVRKLDVAIGLLHRPAGSVPRRTHHGLDPEARAEMWAEIQARPRGGMTILLTTHYLEEADRLAEQLAIVDRGRIVAGGTPEELKSELQGDTIQVELADRDVPAALAAVENMPGSREVTLDGRTLRALPTAGPQCRSRSPRSMPRACGSRRPRSRPGARRRLPEARGPRVQPRGAGCMTPPRHTRQVTLRTCA